MTNLANGVSHQQTLQANTGRSGWAYRQGGSVTGSDGNPVTVREMYALPSGLGFSAFWLPPTSQGAASARLGVSVTQPPLSTQP